MGFFTPGPGATAGDDTYTGDGTDESANGLGGNDTLNGAGGFDVLTGGPGVDQVFGGESDDTLIIYDNDEAAGEVYDGGAGNDLLIIGGFVGSDTRAYTLTSIEAITFLNVGASLNALYLNSSHIGAGAVSLTAIISTYMNTINDLVVVFADTPDADFDLSGWTVLNFQPGVDHINLYGSAGSNTLIGTSVTDWLNGDTGADQLFGGDGDDDLRGEFTLGGDGAADTLSGGDGSDYYIIQEGIDVVIELPNQGNSDVVYAAVAYTLPENVENLYLDPLALFGTGNGLINAITGSTAADTLSGLGGNDYLDGADNTDTLYGGEGDDTLVGGAGADNMQGGNGDDRYLVDDAGDITTEGSALGGTDTVESSVTRTLTANLENLTLTGVAAITGYGNTLNNTIVGNSAANSVYGFDGDDVLDGGLGADAMFGGNGNDAYFVDNAGDITSEASALGGSDTVISSVSRNLTTNIEGLLLTGSANLTGAGNSLDNTVEGNSGANTLYGFDGNDFLDGRIGADTMFGANGDDVYVVDDVGDITVEGSALGGVDMVMTYISRNLNANFEHMWLLVSATTAYGNVLDNTLTGNDLVNYLYGFDGADTLVGGLGADQMFGGNGNDRYYVDDAGDITSEISVSGGTDTVFTTVTRNLTANIENLTLTGSANITGAGNTLNNVINGNVGANTLYGLDGNDTLNGNLGADVLQGGGGADNYVFTTAIGSGNVDSIVGFNVADDTIVLRDTIFAPLTIGALGAGQFVVGAAAADADDYIIYNSATGALYFDADGNGGGAQVQFATLAAGLALTSSDFIISGP